MSIRLMSLAWALPLPATDKIVLLALADWSNEDGHCWPSMVRLADKSGLTDRSTRAIVARLVVSGHLTRQENIGKGVNYWVHPGSETPERASRGKCFRGKEIPQTPERPSANTSGTIIPLKAKPSAGRATKRTAIPANFKPIMSGKTSETVAAWPDGRFEEELEAFIDHHTAKGTLSKCWQASWRTWVRNSRKWDNRDGLRTGKQPVARPESIFDALDRAIDKLEGPDTGGNEANAWRAGASLSQAGHA